jgi:arabinose-5-phosphate isomerase
MPANFDFRQSAQRVLRLEIQAVEGLYQTLDEQFTQACQMLFACKGKVVVMGMGKSGHIARKMAASFASTGTPAFFVHPGEASHGDLGMISQNDIVIAISNSGESNEIIAVLPVIKRWGIPLICMTSRPESTMAKESDVHLCLHVEHEACPLGLAPTSSTTATLVLGDALAVSLLEARGFTPDDFAMSHPGGALGRKLLLRNADIMHQGDLLPIVDEQASVSDALLEMSRKGLGMTAILDVQGTLAGIFTDGDLRRILDQQLDIHSTPITKVMTTNCITVPAELLVAQSVKLMQERKINALIVLDKQRHPVGAFNMHDVLKAGVV